ncbi:MAG: DUF1499 domain-containing protein [Parvularcula sp.]|nr:DUF1499 domain-containing protein [Parvularcula sp.]
MRHWPRIATLLSLAVVLIYLCTIYGYRLDLLDLGAMFGFVRMLIIPLAVAAVLALAATLALLMRRAWLASIAALFVAAAAAGFAYLPIWMRGEASKVPPIHDITTDTQDPPEFVATAALRKPDENPAAYDTAQTEQQREAYPELKSLVMPKRIDEAFAIAMDAVKAEGLDIVDINPREGRIEATETVPLFGFKDDVVIRLRNAHNRATVIDIRSKSRVGRSDLGFNARRIESLLERMEEEGGKIEMTSAPQPVMQEPI